MAEEALMGTIFMTAINFNPRGYLYCNGQQLQINQYTALFALLGTTYGGDGKANFRIPDLCGRVPVGQGQSLFPTPDRTVRQLGATWGSETTTLSVNNMPAHDHAATAQTSLAGGGGSGTVDFSKATATATTTVTVENTLAQDSDPAPGNGSYLALPNDPGIGGTPVIYRPAPATGASTFTLGGVNTNVTLSGTTSVNLGQIAATTSVGVGLTGSGLPFTNLPPSLAINFVMAVQANFPSRN